MREIRDFTTAQHEAAHVVVGCAVGLRLYHASVAEQRIDRTYVWKGHALFRGRALGEAWALMFAAGVAWDRAVGARGCSHSYDAQQARKLCYNRRGYEAVLRAAAALLSGLTPEHARVTRALLERDLTADDVGALCRGEELE